MFETTNSPLASYEISHQQPTGLRPRNSASLAAGRGGHGPPVLDAAALRGMDHLGQDSGPIVDTQRHTYMYVYALAHTCIYI